MASKEKSKLAIATEAARANAEKAAEGLKTAADNFAKAANKTNEAAVTKAKAAVEEADKALTDAQHAERTDRFKRLGGIRVGNALKTLELISALTNKASYFSTPEQEAKIIGDLSAAVTKVSKAFETARNSTEKKTGARRTAYDL